MRIYLADLNYDQGRPLAPVPLNAGYIAAYASAEFQDLLDISLFKSPAALLEALDHAAPDILGLSGYIWNNRLNNFVADYAKKQSPNTIVVVGGPNFRTDPESIRSLFVQSPDIDYCVLFAGEIPFANLIRHFINRNPEDRRRGAEIEGCFTLSDKGQLIGQLYTDPRKELDYLPSPYLTGFLDPFLKAGHTPLFETNRGCPYHCTFCVWGISALTKLRQFSLERVLAEFDYVENLDLEMPEWRLADANFGILKRDAMIARYIRDIYDRNPKSFSYVDVWWGKNPTRTMVDVARALGNLTMGYVAFQSLDPDVLDAIERSNISTDRLIEFIKDIRPHVSNIHTDLLVGLPKETYESNLSSYRQAIKLGFTSIGGGEVRMLPGSAMDTDVQRDKFGLMTKWRVSAADVGHWRGEIVFELEEAVRGTNAMSEDEMIDLRVIRSILYGSAHLGYLTPVIAATRAADIDFVGIIARLVRDRDVAPNVSALIDQLKVMAREEFFDTEAAARVYFADPVNAKNLLENPPVKFNFLFVSTLVHNQEAGREFGEFIERMLVEAGFPAPTASELIAFCKASLTLDAAIYGAARPTHVVPVSDETRGLLVDGGWLPEGSTGDIVLEIDPHRLVSIQHWLDERQPLTFSDVTQFWEVFSFSSMRPAATLSRSKEPFMVEATP